MVEHYSGRVSVDARTFEQRAESDVSLTLRYPAAGVPEVVSRATLDVRGTATSYDVAIELVCLEGDEEIARRRWERGFPRST